MAGPATENGSSTPGSGGGPTLGSARSGHDLRNAPAADRLTAGRGIDAPDIDLLATFYSQLAGWQRVPDDDDDDWILANVRIGRSWIVFAFEPKILLF
jgi:hypothetical protein